MQCLRAQSTLNWGKPYMFCTERSVYFVNVLRLLCTSRCLGALRRLVVTTLYILYSLAFTHFFTRMKTFKKPKLSRMFVRSHFLNHIDDIILWMCSHWHSHNIYKTLEELKITKLIDEKQIWLIVWLYGWLDLIIFLCLNRWIIGN